MREVPSYLTFWSDFEVPADPLASVRRPSAFLRKRGPKIQNMKMSNTASISPEKWQADFSQFVKAENFSQNIENELSKFVTLVGAKLQTKIL